MKKNLAFCSLLLCIICSMYGCKNNTANKPLEKTGDTIRLFYPVIDYFKEQIENVDNTSPFIYKITIKNGRKDSVALNKQQFNQWAQAFIEYDINDKSLHKLYTENIFLDETTNSYTFNYTAKDSSLPLQSLTVLLDAGDQHVKRVFITKVKSYGDTLVTEKGGWKNDKNFYINSITEAPGNVTTTQQNIIVWNNQP